MDKDDSAASEGTSMDAFVIARDELAHAALAYVRAQIDPREHAHSAADVEWAEEKMCLAARRVTRAVEALPESRQPIGWDEATVDV